VHPAQGGWQLQYPPPPRRRRYWHIVAGVLIVLAGLAGATLIINGHNPHEVGECVVATGERAKTTNFEEIDCASPDAAYRIAREAQSCGSTTYGYWRLTGSKSSGVVYCLTLNARVGDCFHQTIGFPTGRATKVECGPAATYRVAARYDEVRPASACGVDAITPGLFDETRPMALIYPEPPLTICTEEV
jgi:hypothetical protein